VRGVNHGEVVLTSYGVASGFCIDPIEKKPLNHFLPGTPILSFGQFGCNLTCRYCQNWGISKATRDDPRNQGLDLLCEEKLHVEEFSDTKTSRGTPQNSAILDDFTSTSREFPYGEKAIQNKDLVSCQSCQNWNISKAREFDKLQDQASPEQIADAALQTKCRSVAYTYNDPVIFLEYAVDTARACRERGIKNVAVTAGYICPDPRAEFYHWMDAANVDLKAFTEHFYKELCTARLDSVLDTLKYLKHDTDVWFEITDLLIPGENDSDAEIDEMTSWIVKHLGEDVPLHFSAFHPDWKMMDKPRTPPETLLRARKIAMENGVRHAYVGNVHDHAAQSTYCHNCGEILIGRDWYLLSDWNVSFEGNYAGNCSGCGEPVPGVFDGPPGDWGRKRVPLRLRPREPAPAAPPP
jgi:pyruvate formate lyase activating enzyme